MPKERQKRKKSYVVPQKVNSSDSHWNRREPASHTLQESALGEFKVGAVFDAGIYQYPINDGNDPISLGLDGVQHGPHYQIETSPLL